MQHELWRVQLGNGEVREMSLDALDSAFDQGIVNEHTPVLAPGAFGWERLGKVAGLDDESAPVSNPEGTPSLSPMAIGSLPPPPRLPQDLLDLDLLDDNALEPKRRAPKIIGGVVAALAIAAGVFFVAKVNVGAQTAGVALEPATPVVAAPPPPAAMNIPEPAETKPAAPQLSEETKKKLAEADKARDVKVKAKNAERARSTLPTKRAPKAKAPSGSSDRFDPLNGNL